jgi:NTE family protein
MASTGYIPEVQQLIADFKKSHQGKIYSDVTDSAGNQYVDLVMEGGGVLGVALVGYTYALEQLGLRFWRIGGASAGAINSMLLAAGNTFGEPASEEVLGALGELDMASLIDGGWLSTSFIKRVVLGSGAIRTIAALVYALPIAVKLWRKEGLNPGSEFVNWVQDFLHKAAVKTNSELLDRIAITKDLLYRGSVIPKPDPKTNPRLAIVASDVSTQTKAQFPWMAPMYWNDDQVADPALFVRASMSIPMFFTPFVADTMPTGEEAIRRWQHFNNTDVVPTGSCTFIDGGMMSNFPISLFHAENDMVPRAPTFGARLNKKNREVQNTSKLPPLLGAILNTSRHTLDYDFLMNHPDYQNLITYIDTGSAFWLNFYLTDEDKRSLFKAGVRDALTFLDGFDWEAYKQVRRKLGNTVEWTAAQPVAV